MKFFYPSGRHKCKGFTLIESLVAMLVLSLGVLGVAALHINSLKTAHAAYQRSYATLAAQDLLERIWIETVQSSDVSVCPTATELVAAGGVFSQWVGEWQNSILPSLSDSELNADSEDCQYELSVKWLEERFSLGSTPSVLVFILSVPEFG